MGIEKIRPGRADGPEGSKFDSRRDFLLLSGFLLLTGRAREG
jgi:hypothetical protein